MHVILSAAVVIRVLCNSLITHNTFTCMLLHSCDLLVFQLLDFLIAFCLAKVAVIHHHQQVSVCLLHFHMWLLKGLIGLGYVG